MAQFYTLDEAAIRLGIPQEEFKRRLKTEWTSIRPFRDGATLRFRAADIDELARSLGAASDPGLQLAPPGVAPADPDPASDEFPDMLGGSTPDEPLRLTDDSSVEELTLPADSGVNLAPPKKSGDSDVKLEKHARHAAPDPEDSLPTEEISLDLGGSGVIKGGSDRLAPPKSGTNLGGAKPNPIGVPSNPKKTSSDSSSEFELSLDADSDSFELQMHTDSSDEVDIGVIGLADENRSGNSGINLGKPSDSGVSLEKKGPKTAPIAKSPPPPADDSDDDLALEMIEDPTGPSGHNLVASDDSDSEFELSLDDSSGITDSLAGALESNEGEASSGDIFETDFELPAVSDDSGSEVVSVDESEVGSFDVDATDLDAVAEEDSGSEVVMVEDDDAVVVEDDDAVVVEDDADVFGDSDLEEGASASKALRGVRRGADDEDEMPVRTVAATPPPWGPLPAAVLMPCLILVFLGGLMSFEALRGMWGYHQPAPPSNMLVRGVADMFGMKTTDAPGK